MGDHTSDFFAYQDVGPKGTRRIYIGQFLERGSKIMQGMGIRIYTNGEFEEGYWKNGKKHGYGRSIYPKGGVFEGEFKNNAKHGYGEYTFADGEKFIGNYKDGKRHGDGTVIKPDGTTTSGRYENDVCVENYNPS